jgi:hypothetical protein
MKNKDIQSNYLSGSSEDRTEESIRLVDDISEGQTPSTDIGTIMDSIDEEYLRESAQTKDESMKQYGLSKPKKTIIRANLQND